MMKLEGTSRSRGTGGASGLGFATAKLLGKHGREGRHFRHE